MQIQQSSRENAELLSAEFQRRYEPNFAWGQVISNYLMLPALRGFWPCSANNTAGGTINLCDIANGYSPAMGAVIGALPIFSSIGLIPYIELLRANGDYFVYVDDPQFDILGTEAYISSKGCTFGFWAYPYTLGNPFVEFAKYQRAVIAQQSYAAYIGAGNSQVISFGNGVAVTSAASVSAVQTDTWQFVAGRFIPATSVDVYLNTSISVLEKTTVATGNVAIVNSAATLNIGSFSNVPPQDFFDGRLSLIFITASALTDAQIYSLYHQSRPLFGR